jgi:hypothetical protein
MRPRLRTVVVAGVVALGGLLVTGTRDAKAQVYINTPGFSLGLGAPYTPVYPTYSVVPAAPIVTAAPVVTPVVPYYRTYYPVRPYVVGRPVYAGRVYGGYYAPYRHRRW